MFKSLAVLVTCALVVTSVQGHQLSFISQAATTTQTVPWSPLITRMPLAVTLYCESTGLGGPPNTPTNCQITPPASPDDVIIEPSTPTDWIITSDDDPITFNIDVSAIPEPASYPFDYVYTFEVLATAEEDGDTIDFTLTLTDACGGGYFTATGAECAACPVGSISTGAGPTSCDDCPAGSSTSTIASTACILCSRNTFSPSPGSACQACSLGKEATEAGATECTDKNESAALPTEVAVAIATIAIISVFLGAFVFYRLKTNPARPHVGSKSPSSTSGSEAPKAPPSESADDAAV